MPAPYFFCDALGIPAFRSPQAYLAPDTTYHFPLGHRLAGNKTTADMEPMRRDLFRLFVRLDYDVDAFMAFLSHGISELVLPFCSPHVKMTGGWLYSSGRFHSGLDFNDEPLEGPAYRYSDHCARTNFDVHAAAPGTIVGWDGTKLLTLEHVSADGRLYRTFYNMTREVPLAPTSTDVVHLGMGVFGGQLLGEAWDPPENVLHLHFGMAIPHTSPAGWLPPEDLNPLFAKLEEGFEVTFTPTEQTDIVDFLEEADPWPKTEWFSVDPFGRYDISKSSLATYGPVGRGFYYPVPPGPGTNAFRDGPIGGDPGGDRIPLFAWHEALLNKLPVQPLSMGMLFAAFE